MTPGQRFSAGLFAFLVTVSSVFAGGNRFEALLKPTSDPRKLTCWVFFTDKGTLSLSKASWPGTVVSERSLQRRLHVLPAGQLVDETDYPLEQKYVEQVATLVTKVRQRSKWLNGISVEATSTQLARVSELPFVKEIEPVARFWNKRIEGETSPSPPPAPGVRKEAGTEALDYGPSFDQLHQINVPAVHATGNSAQGILIGVLDDGVRLLNHQAFDSLRSRIVAMHDFVDNKTDVTPNNPSGGFGAHGVYTLSALAGYHPGQLIGPAYGASYILARTDNDSSGPNADFYPSEEDDWIAAVEWAESLGVQVTSSSIGYLEHLAFIDSMWQVDPATSWKWSDMDGKTIPISRAATLAARKGVIVVNSAGNEAANYAGMPNTLIAPADADSIITVGAVGSTGLIAYFSSYGPTVDGRIKPDVVARGTTVRCADSAVDSLYTYVGGTSLACPLVAGAAALVLKAHPNARPMEIINALKATANNAASPNNRYGWGVINVLAAIDYLERPATSSSTQYLSVRGTTVSYVLPEPAIVTIMVFNILGQEVKMLLDNAQTPAASSVTWDAKSSGGYQVASGTYIFRLEAKGVSGNTYLDAGKTIILH